MDISSQYEDWPAIRHRIEKVLGLQYVFPATDQDLTPGKSTIDDVEHCMNHLRSVLEEDSSVWSRERKSLSGRQWTARCMIPRPDHENHSYVPKDELEDMILRVRSVPHLFQTETFLSKKQKKRRQELSTNNPPDSTSTTLLDSSSQEDDDEEDEDEEDEVMKKERIQSLEEEELSSVHDLLTNWCISLTGNSFVEIFSSKMLQNESKQQNLPLYSFLPYGNNLISAHPNIVKLIRITVTNEAIYVLHDTVKHTLLSVSRFHASTTLSSGTLTNTTGEGCKDLRLRFMIFQLLHGISFLHSRGLVLDSLKSSSVYLDDEMWLTLPIGLSNRSLRSAEILRNRLKYEMKRHKKQMNEENPESSMNSHPFITTNSTMISSSSLNSIDPPHDDEEKEKSTLQLSSDSLPPIAEESIPRPPDYYEPITMRWLNGKLSNFEYLMTINYAVGRTMTDPLYHPILPWVTNFTAYCLPENSSTNSCLNMISPAGKASLRDLSMTKFRLSKGDTQLDTTYCHSEPPHHIPESLSELTYYIYMSRRTPMQVLRRVVRDVFVPEHYPPSMSRIYEWTPDECIPEFYVDASVFSSNHRKYGLQDLELPSFAPTPEEFIAYHRRVLESDAVSSKLHEWIDLTFGYCLEGEAAIQHMNVPLKCTLSVTSRLGLDSPNVNKNPGFVMLFGAPHPARKVSEKRLNESLLNATMENKIMKEIQEDDEEFHRLNPLQTINLSSKYQPSSISMTSSLLMNGGTFNMNRLGNDLLGLAEYVRLDSFDAVPAASMLFTSSSGANGPTSTVTSGMVTGGTTSAISASNAAAAMAAGAAALANAAVSTVADSLDATLVGSNSNKRPVPIRKSLFNSPPGSLSPRLRQLSAIRLNEGDVGVSAVEALLLQEEHCKFYATTAASSVDGCHSLVRPYCEARRQGCAEPTDGKPRMDIRGGGSWDSDWSDALCAAADVVKKNEEQAQLEWSDRLKNDVSLSEAEAHQLVEEAAELARLQAEDLHAIGCMIGELYTGRALLSIAEAEALRTSDLPTAIRTIHRLTSGLPLPIRRLITLLLQPCHALRPRIAEILACCLVGMRDSEEGPSPAVLTIAGRAPPQTDGVSAGLWKNWGQAQQRGGGWNGEYGSDDLVSPLSPLNSGSVYDTESSPSVLLSTGFPANSLLASLHGSANLPAGGTFLRRELLSDICIPLFPSYFHTIHALIGAVRMATDSLHGLAELIRRVDIIRGLPLEGLNLALFVLLEVLGDASPFTRARYDNSTSERQAEICEVLRGYWQLVDAFGVRLGVEVSERLLLPVVLKFVQAQEVSACVVCLLESPLWSVCSLRGGTKCFVRLFLPQMLTYLASGALHCLLRRGKNRVGVNSDDNKNVLPSYYGAQSCFEAPVWSFVESGDAEWLRGSEAVEVRRIQKAASLAIVALSEPDALGTGLSVRYLVPALLSLIGVPILAVSGFDPGSETIGMAAKAHSIHEKLCNFAQSLEKENLENTQSTSTGSGPPSNSGYAHASATGLSLSGESLLNHPDCPVTTAEVELVEAYVASAAVFNAEEMFVTSAIVQLASRLGEMVVAELILPTLFSLVLPDLLTQLSSPNDVREGVSAAFMEVVLLLNGLLPSLSPEIIQTHLLASPRLTSALATTANSALGASTGISTSGFGSGSSSCYCLPQLLSGWPLTAAWSFLDMLTHPLHTATVSLSHAITAVRRQGVLLELCRLTVSMSMMAGPEATADLVLPHVDTFFRAFVLAYGLLPVESRAMLKSFELAAELYLPLVQLMGAELFYTVVPHLNPRLEVWLSSIGSSVPPKSPPLPANILPELAHETTSAPEKKRGLMRWLSDKSRWMSGAPSSNAGGANVPTAAVVVSSGASGSATGGIVHSTSRNNLAMFTHSGSSSELSSLPLRGMSIGQDVNSSAPSTTNATESTPRRPSYTAALFARATASHQKPSNSEVLTPTGAGTELVSLSSDPAARLLFSDTLISPSSTLPPHSTASITSNTTVSMTAASVTDLDLIRSDSGERIAEIWDAGLPLEDDVLPAVSNDVGDDSSKSFSSPIALPVTAPPQTDDPLGHLAITPPSTLPAPNPYSSRDDVPASELLSPSTVLFSPCSEAHTSTDIPSALSGGGSVVAGGDTQSSASSLTLATGTTIGSLIGESQSTTLSASALAAAREVSDRSTPFRAYQKLMTGRHHSSNANSRQSRIISTPRGTPLHASSSSRITNTSTTKSRLTKVGPFTVGGGESETIEEVESRELRYSEQAWLLAGSGRWNVEKEIRDRTLREQSRLLKGNTNSSVIGSVFSSNMSRPLVSNNDWIPAAQLSMTAPRITVDLSADNSNSSLPFNLQTQTQWKLEEPPGIIRCMVANPQESLLMTSSRTGVRLWSLSTHPLQHVSTYNNHPVPPFNGAFLRGGHQAMTCDGSVHIWDIERRRALSILTTDRTLSSSLHSSASSLSASLNSSTTAASIGYTSATILSSKFGVNPSIDAVGDEQLLLTAANTVSLYDLRSNPAYRIAEWTLPSLPSSSGFMTSANDPLVLSCATSCEYYVYAGATNGGMWVVDRRMGRVLTSWQAHDSPIVRLTPMSDRHVLSVAERSAVVWEFMPNSGPGYGGLAGNGNLSNGIVAGGGDTDDYLQTFWGGGEVRRVQTIKGGSDHAFSHSNVLIAPVESSGGLKSPGGVGGLDMSGRPQQVLYSLSGNKLYTGFLPSYQTTSRDRIAGLGAGWDPSATEYEELRLAANNFVDRKGAKISRSKLSITSAVLLPLRRLMLLGTEDGLVRVVS